MTALSQYNSFNSWGWLDHISCLDQIKVATGDVRDAHFCAMLTKKIDIVFHLAALIPIPYSYLAPESYVDTNVKGTLHLCQSALANGVSRFIQTSTSEVYGTARSYLWTRSTPECAVALQRHQDRIRCDCHEFLSFIWSACGDCTAVQHVWAAAICSSCDPNDHDADHFRRQEIWLGDVRTTQGFTTYRWTPMPVSSTMAGMESGCGEVFNIGSHSEMGIGDLLS